MNIAIVDPYSSIGYFSSELKKEKVKLVAVYSAAHLAKLVPEDLFVKVLNLYEQGNASIVASLRALDVEAVINGSDFASVSIADSLNKDLGVDFGNYKTPAYLRSNKYLVNESIKLAGLPTIEQELIDTLTIPERIKHKMKNWEKIYVKPVRSAGTFGGALYNNIKEVEEHIKKYFNIEFYLAGKMNEFIAQQYVNGNEYVLDTVSRRGKHAVIGVYAYKKVYFNNCSLCQLCYTIDIKSKEAVTIIDYGLKVLDAIGYVDGIAHTEIFLADGKPLLVEVNPRISGGSGFINMIGSIVFNRTQPQYLALGLKNPPAFARINQIPKLNKSFAIIYHVQSFKRRFIRRLKVEMVNLLETYTGNMRVLKENCLVEPPKNLIDTIAYIILAGDEAKIMSDVAKLEEMEKTGIIFE